MWSGSVALLAVMAVAAVPAHAQAGGSAVMTGLRGLTFGTLVPGMAVTVPPTDPSRRGEFSVSGTGHADIYFDLPSELTGPGGTSLAIRFRASDGLFYETSSSSPVQFDPRQPQRFRLRGAQHTSWIYLGAVVEPTAHQSAGSYSGTITVLLVDPGT